MAIGRHIDYAIMPYFTILFEMKMCQTKRLGQHRDHYSVRYALEGSYDVRTNHG